MNVFLVGINASYMHTCAAVRSICGFVKKYADAQNDDIRIDFAEYTVNQPVQEILRGIHDSNADVILISAYIWNIEIVEKILPDIKKILPGCIVGAGGPEVGYAPDVYLKKNGALDFIVSGEGEVTVFELLKAMCKNTAGNFFTEKNCFVPGIYYFSNRTEKIVFTGLRNAIDDLSVLPFLYPELLSGDFDTDNKIYYFESSRGCPYRCSYCLSSVEQNVRFKSLEQTFSELQIFLDANVRLVKFVDRTFNLNPGRYIQIWNYILLHHNGKTVFHFEIEAEHLSEEALSFLQTVPAGVMQFEIGIQSANRSSLKAVNRSDNIARLQENIRRLPKTIHRHLDLIAGLPYEDMESFGNSFDFAMDLKPDALQLGFLKILHGTDMEKYAAANGWKWQEHAVYETLSTPYMTFDGFQFLKDIEKLTDAFWNKKSFSFSMNYIFRKIRPWIFFSRLCCFARKKDVFAVSHRELFWFELLSDFFDSADGCGGMPFDKQVARELLRFDFVRLAKRSSFPSWYVHRYDKNKHRALLEQKGLLHSTRLAFAMTEFETFDYDVKSDVPEKNPGTFEMLIEYTR